MNRSVELMTNNVTLNISVTRDLVKEEGALKNLGYFIVDGGSTGDNAVWDNIEFFFDVSKKDFKGECRDELKKLGFDWKAIYKEIKKLVEEAKRLNLIILP